MAEAEGFVVGLIEGLVLDDVAIEGDGSAGAFCTSGAVDEDGLA